MTRGFLVVALLAALALALGDVRAAPLDAATCGQLKGEQVRMEQGGVRDTMAKGPDWAKANLAADKLDQIRRLIELDEQLLFRCSTRNLVDLPPDADADPAAVPPAAIEDGKAATAGKAGAPPPAAKSAPAPAASAKPPAAGPKPKGAAKAAPAPAKAAPARQKQAPARDSDAAPSSEKAAAAKPKPKPKPDDAYKPPPPNPSVDPFANQPARQSQ